MSARARTLKGLYMRHKITVVGLQQALADKVITMEEYELIVYGHVIHGGEGE